MNKRYLHQTLKAGLFIGLLIISPGCASLENADVGRMFQSFGIRTESARIESLKVKADQLLTQGMTDKVLQLLRDEINKPEAPDALTSRYIKALNQTIAHADQQVAAEQFLEAGRRYRMSMKFYPANDKPNKSILLSREEIGLKLDTCADKLLQNGLQSYRTGQLEGAINVWSQIREFHPSYKASLRAIETTRTQLKKLGVMNQDTNENGI